MRKLILFLFIIFNTVAYTQIKVGDNPSVINSNSLLELESEDKVLVITKMSSLIMNSITPLQGALVYNTDTNCVYTFTGSSWVSLCDTSTTTGITVTTNSTAPTTNTIGDFWINDANNNAVSIWDGASWVPIDNNPRKGNGVPTATTANNPIAGEIYVDATTGAIYAYDGTTWVNSNTTLSANNGVIIDTDNTVQLGGVLIKPTVIATDPNNTLAITGLQEGDVTEDDVVVVNQSTGILKKTSISNLFREEIATITANDGQVQFTPPLLISDSKKVNVYRNGVRIDFTVVDNTTIEIEPEAICYAGDEIRIVQFY